MKTYLHFCIYLERNSLEMYWNENLSTNFLQKRDAIILGSIYIFRKSKTDFAIIKQTTAHVSELLLTVYISSVFAAYKAATWYCYDTS